MVRRARKIIWQRRSSVAIVLSLSCCCSFFLSFMPAQLRGMGSSSGDAAAAYIQASYISRKGAESTGRVMLEISTRAYASRELESLAEERKRARKKGTKKKRPREPKLTGCSRRVVFFSLYCIRYIRSYNYMVERKTHAEDDCDNYDDDHVTHTL